MSLLTVGSVAFDAIETPFGKTDKIIGGAGTYIALSSSFFKKNQNIVSVVGGDFPQDMLDLLSSKGVNLNGLQIKKDDITMMMQIMLPTNVSELWVKSCMHICNR